MIIFAYRHKKSGPGNESKDLDLGVVSLAQFIKEADSLEAERIDLLSSERLLDLPISSYPELKMIRSELLKLKPIYELYTEQKVTNHLQRLIVAIYSDLQQFHDCFIPSTTSYFFTSFILILKNMKLILKL